MKRFLYWTSMVILWAVCLWGAYGIRETYRGTLDIVFRGYDPEASVLVTQNIRTIYSAFREECHREVEIDLAKRKLVDNMEHLQQEQKKEA